MPRGRRLLYALGHPGFLISDRIVVTIAFYFYLPPAGRGLEPVLSERIFLGVLTTWGVARLLGGIVDSLADPFVGWGSDRSRSRFGRRRSYLMLGAAPMCLLPAAVFWPPGPPGSVMNFALLAVVLALYYVFFTVYVGPYLALIPELARGTRERLDLSAWVALAGLPVLILMQPAWLWGFEAGRAAGLESADAIRVVVVALVIVSFLLCLLPILAVDEGRFAESQPSAMPLREAVLVTLRNRPFLVYLAAQICFILGVTMLQPAIPYYAVVVMGRDEGFAAQLSLAMAPAALVGFVAVRAIGARFGPRRAIMGCIATLGVAAALLGALRPGVPGGPADAWNLAVAYGSMLLSGVALAGFFVLPHVLMGQVIDLDERRVGANRSAMFYGVQGLLTKWVYQVSLALMSLLLIRFGNSAEEPLGVLLIGPVAGLLCLASVLFYVAYPERRLLEQLGGDRASAGELCHPAAGSVEETA